MVAYVLKTSFGTPGEAVTLVLLVIMEKLTQLEMFAIVADQIVQLKYIIGKVVSVPSVHMQIV